LGTFLAIGGAGRFSALARFMLLTVIKVNRDGVRVMVSAFGWLVATGRTAEIRRLAQQGEFVKRWP
jgi:hypothetical protein